MMKWRGLFAPPPVPDSANAGSPAGKMPDFVVIGAQKAGTTWLFDNLVGQEDVWLPPSKEIHYFDNLWPDSHLFATLRERMQEELNKQDCDYGELLWRARLAFVRPRDDAWYASLFAPAGERLAGDITPAYSLLDEAAVARAHSIMPHAKIIFIMRDPIDRIWSHFCFSRSWIAKGLNDSELTEAFAIAEMESAAYDLRTRYLRTLRHWEACFPPGQMLTLFYDDIALNPKRVLEDVHRFIGARKPLRLEESRLANRSNETSYVTRLPGVDRHFARKYIADIEALAGRFGGYPAQWLERAKALAERR